MATYHKAHIAKFNKDIRAALAARASKLGYQAIANMSLEHLEQELTALMNDEAYQDRFETQDDFTPYFKTAFKKELLLVADFRKVAPEVVEYIGQLPTEEELTEEATEQVAQPEAAAIAAALTEELPGEFLVVELRTDEAVAVPFNDVNSARKYAKRRNMESVLSQVATAEQYRERLNPDSMLGKFNLLDRPYRFGEYVEPEMKVAKPAEAPVVKPTVEKKAAVEKPAAPAGDAVLKPAPKRVLLPVPENAPAQQVLQAKLANLTTMDEFHALIAEAAAAGLQLVQRAYNKPVQLVTHNASEVYAEVFCLHFAYPEKPEKKVCKAFLHVLPKYYQLAPAA